MTCPKCEGTGWYIPKGQRRGEFETVYAWKCDACCKHEDGWWELTKFYTGFEEGKDNACCHSGCGTMRRDL